MSQFRSIRMIEEELISDSCSNNLRHVDLSIHFAKKFAARFYLQMSTFSKTLSFLFSDRAF